MTKLISAVQLPQDKCVLIHHPRLVYPVAVRLIQVAPIFQLLTVPLCLSCVLVFTNDSLHHQLLLIQGVLVMRGEPEYDLEDDTAKPAERWVSKNSLTYNTQLTSHSS
jgi:hypothetical protein